MPKDYEEFRRTLKMDRPNSAWPESLKSLWFEAKGDWGGSHNIAEDLKTIMGNWIHAYLHRKEGDDWNAGYWYRQAGKSFPKTSLEHEHREIVEYILNQ